MKKKITLIALVAIITISSVSIYKNTQSELPDLTLTNIEALARLENAGDYLACYMGVEQYMGSYFIRICTTCWLMSSNWFTGEYYCLNPNWGR